MANNSVDHASTPSIAGSVNFDQFISHCERQRENHIRRARLSHGFQDLSEARMHALTALTAEILIVLCEDASAGPLVKAAFTAAIDRIRER